MKKKRLILREIEGGGGKDNIRKHVFILSKSKNATLQLSIFCEKVLDKKYLLNKA